MKKCAIMRFQIAHNDIIKQIRFQINLIFILMLLIIPMRDKLRIMRSVISKSIHVITKVLIFQFIITCFIMSMKVAVAIMIALNFGLSGEGLMTKAEADLLLVLICGYVAAFAWSWGPLGWLVPSEICPLEIRSAGQAINVSVNMLFTFLIAQVFLSMLCRLKFGLFFFFAAFVVIMTLFIYIFLPETKNVPIEEMNRVWKAHWFWSKYIPDEAVIGDHQSDKSEVTSETV